MNHITNTIANQRYLTDGGIETTLIFLDGHELPYFAAFNLLKTEDGRLALRKYYEPYARIARSETIAIARSDYIQAVVLQGASTWRILFRHIVPLCISSVIVRLTLDMAGIILTAAGLGFLGLGAQPPAAEWGAMVSAGREVILDQWWVATIPGAAIFIVSLGFNLLGDGLRDVLDPKGR